MPGAVLMNTAAALRSGAALVTTCLPESVRAKAAVAYPEAMWRGLSTGRDGVVSPANLKEVRALLADKDALLIGSGMGEKAVKLIGAIAATASTNAPAPSLTDSQELFVSWAAQNSPFR